MSRPTNRGGLPAAPGDRHGSERGQLLVIFALALVALVGMTGLILDGGDTFLQRRDEQNVADAAAMAAGYAYLSFQDETAAARAVAAANGYVHGTDGTSVNVNVGAESITVDVSRPHRNSFAGVMGFASWNVSATASVQAGVPNGAYGAMPIIINKKGFDKPGSKDPNAPLSYDEPGSGSNDIPKTDSTFNWTVFCTANNSCNADSQTVDQIINQKGQSTTVYLDDKISPLNAGAHATLFDSLSAQVGTAFPIAIVDDAGKMLGWAWFHLTGSVGGSTKQISGWFDGDVNAPPMTIVQGRGTAVGSFGSYVVKLTN